MFTHKIDGDTQIRLLEQRHAEELFALTDRNRDHLRAWLVWVDETRTVEDTKQFLKHALEQFVASEGFHAGIWHKGEMVGSIAVTSIDWLNRKAAIGYWISAPFQGRGLITKACGAVIEHAFNELELNRVEIHCAADNKKSRAIAQRLGFHEEATLRQAIKLYDHFTDMVVYAMLKQQWAIGKQ